MTTWYRPFLLVLFLGLHGCSITRIARQKHIQVSSGFDCGSIGAMRESAGNLLTGTTRHWRHKTSSDDQYYWFYFRMDHVENMEVTVKLTNLAGIYRGKPHLIYTRETQPVFSYDRETWHRITDVSYDSAAHTLIFRNKFLQDSVWVAYAHPYPYSRELEFIHSLPKENPFLTTEIIGASAQARQIRLVTITDPSAPDSKKKVVLITTLQHAGEYIGGFFAEGMIRHLLSANPDAVRARKNFIYKIIPMMNPDGIYHGMTRLNASHEDLNQEWDDDFTDTVHAPTEPEVAGVKKWIRNWMLSGKTIDLALDVHSQGQEGTINILHTPPNVLNRLAEKLHRYWPIENIEMTFSGSANDCLVNEFNVPAGTIEIPQSTAGGGAYLTIDDYFNYGTGTVQGISDYWFPGGARNDQNTQ